MPLQTIIVEDEEKSSPLISSLIRPFPSDIVLLGSAGHVDKCVQLIEDKPPQLVFMDTQLADGTGFDVLRKVSSRNFELIFVTARSEYALDAFRVSAADYLLKPVDMPAFSAAIGRVKSRIEGKKRPEVTERKIAVATLDGFEFIDQKDLIWCAAEGGGYTRFYTTGGTRLLSSRNLGFYETLLDLRYFYRIHNSFIINLRFLKSYIRGKNGQVVLSDGTRLEMSQRRRSGFLNHPYLHLPDLMYQNAPTNSKVQ